MKECSYCQKQMQDEEMICIFCGYDQKTGTINNNFKAQMAQEKAIREKSQRKKEKLQKEGQFVSPAVKRFAFIGIAVTLFSLFFKYNFSINGVVSELIQPLAKLRNFKFLGIKTKDKKDNKFREIQLTDVKAFIGNKRPLSRKDLKVEGIFFDPQQKSFVAINGQILSEGETLDDVTVKKINRDSVELIISGKSKVFQLNQ